MLGIIAVVAVPRFTGKETFDSLGFFDQAKSTIRYAQKAAIAQRTPVFVTVTANTLSVNYASAATCTALAGFVLNPANGQNFIVNAPSGVSFEAGRQFCFDGLGKPYAAGDTFPTSSLAAAVTLVVQGDNMNRPITVESETGYVR